MTTAYPLAWPANRPRTPAREQREGRFRSDGRDITLTQAKRRLRDEVIRLGGQYLVISLDIPLRKDGEPHAARGPGPDQGAVAYFQLAGKPFALACDTYTTRAMNVAALAAHVEATRAIERHGVASAAESLQAFTALPKPPTCWEILGVPEYVDEVAVQAAWRRLIAKAHPDQGGSEARAAEINRARDEALGILEVRNAR
jgi:hypothetical protein